MASACNPFCFNSSSVNPGNRPNPQRRGGRGLKLAWFVSADAPAIRAPPAFVTEFVESKRAPDSLASERPAALVAPGAGDPPCGGAFRSQPGSSGGGGGR